MNNSAKRSEIIPVSIAATPVADNTKYLSFTSFDNFSGTFLQGLFYSQSIKFPKLYPFGLYYEALPLLQLANSPVFYSNITDVSNLERVIENEEIKDNSFFITDNNNIFWNELYSTPVGIFTRTTKTNPLNNEFIWQNTTNFKNIITLKIEDLYIVPTNNSWLAVQELLITDNVSSSVAGIDDINNFNFFRERSLDIFEITNVSQGVDGRTFIIEFDKSLNINVNSITIEGDASTSLNPTRITNISPTLTPSQVDYIGMVVTGNGIPDNSYIVDIDRHGLWVELNTNVTSTESSVTFTLLKLKKYSFVLLNRNSQVIGESVYDDLWSINKIYTQNLIGDYPSLGESKELYKNYLNYKGSEYIGLKNQLSSLVSNSSSFIVLEPSKNNEVIDRLSTTGFTLEDDYSIEISFPSIFFVEKPSDIFILRNLISEMYTDEYLGRITKLYKEGDTIIYGYVLHDSGNIILTNPELVIALSYNSNRNYILPTIYTNKDKETAWNNKNNSLSVKGAIYTNPYNPSLGSTVTLYKPHPFFNIDSTLDSPTTLYIENMIGASGLSHSTGITLSDSQDTNNLLQFKVKELTRNKYDSGGYVYIKRPDYDYFVTYVVESKKVNGVITTYNTPESVVFPYYNKVDFNFLNSNGLPTIKSTDVSAVMEINFSNLANISTLPDSGDYFKVTIIIGKYLQEDINGEKKNTGVEFLVYNTEYTVDVNNQTVTITRSELNSWNNYIDYFKTLYDIENISTIDPPYLTGKNNIFLGNIKWKEEVSQYNTTFSLTIPADKWNGSQNPTFESGNVNHNKKMISEISFHSQVKDPILGQQIVDPDPLIFAKITPPILKDSLADIKINIQLSF